MPAELYLVGYGMERENLGRLAEALHIAPHVHFPGPTTAPERWYKSFDVHCLPSPVEGFGLTLVESLAAGTPVVAIRTPATSATVRPGIDGILVDHLDAGALASAIAEVTRWRFDRASALAHVSAHFSTEAMLGRTRQILEKILRD